MTRDCPKCGSDESYQLSRNSRFRCRACKHDFSGTSRTALHGRKMPVEKYPLAFEAFRRGQTTMAVAALIGCDYKTAWRLRRVAIKAFEESRCGNASLST